MLAILPSFWAALQIHDCGLIAVPGAARGQTTLLGFSCERLTVLRGWPAKILHLRVGLFQCSQLQINLALIGLDDFLADRAQLLLRLFDFLGDVLQREADFGHFVLPIRAPRITSIGKLGPGYSGLRETAEV
jgi:hypothetical protein